MLFELPSRLPPGDVAAADLKLVAKTFVELQDARHIADYDGSVEWSRSEVYDRIILAEDAVAAWLRVRDSEIAQDYLLDLMGAR
jgi:hypothetical protein